MRSKNNSNTHKSEKITEKQFLRMMVTSVCSILLCLACLISTTWALFSLDITSEDNVIQVGTFGIDVLVERIEAEATGESGEVKEVRTAVLSSAENSYLLHPGTYRVEIHAKDGSTVGHCVVKLDGVTYKTFGIYPYSEEGFTFSIKISVPDEADDTNGFTSVLSIVPVWGNPTADAALASGSKISNIEGLLINDSEETTDMEESTDTDVDVSTGTDLSTNTDTSTSTETPTNTDTSTDTDASTDPQEPSNSEEATPAETPSEEISA